MVVLVNNSHTFWGNKFITTPIKIQLFRDVFPDTRLSTGVRIFEVMKHCVFSSVASKKMINPKKKKRVRKM